MPISYILLNYPGRPCSITVSAEIVNDSIYRKALQSLLITLNRKASDMKSAPDILFVVVFVLIFTSCSEEANIQIPGYLSELENISVYPAESDPEMSVELIRETTYSDNEDVTLGRVTGVLADNQGRVYVGDYDTKTVHVYHSDGSYVTSLGREGEGPGEFGQVSQMNIHNGLIHIYDWSQRRINVFSTESFELAYTTSLDFNNAQNSGLSGWMAISFHILDDGNYLVRFNKPFRPDNLDENKTHRLYKVSSDGQLLSDIILELPVGEVLIDMDIPMIMGVPYSRNAQISISGETLYNLWTEDMAVRTYDVNGQYQSSFYYPVNKSPLNRAELLEQHENEQMKQMIRNAEIPETWPAVQGYIQDDESRFWISRIIDDRDSYEWWVIEPNGTLVSRFTWPRNKSIRQVKDNWLYTLETDEETGLQEIVKYRIDFI